ncbi:hypothetical protein [Polyangium sorediatum]|uniref:Lipoprotein n=1 Tax=Polyangium sorediatum TaxID=889274 RepID=A0ABT6P8E5_9BACT|nr:hypothetical protein [Polyangium sorediatum]MDI1436853.1 hypothetical protein [Polyangium sorediatum]
MTYVRRTRMVGSGGTWRRGGLAVFGAFALSLLPACSGGCSVEFERSEATHADGLYRRLLVGGTEPDGAFVLAQHERAPGEEELVLVSLAEGEKRSCAMGKAFGYTTMGPQPSFSGDEPRVDARPARILAFEGEPGAKSGDLRIFDASCVEHMRVPSVETWPWPIYSSAESRTEAYAARTTSGEVVWIDPWAGSMRTISEGASFWKYAAETFWLIEGGRLVLRDREGNTLQTAGEGVTEVVVDFTGEAAYVDALGLWVLKLGDPAPMAIPTAAAPCKPEYFYVNSLKLAYRDDCAAGVLAVRDLTTGDTRLVAAGVTSARFVRRASKSWIFFQREEPGKKRELWAVPGDGEPVLVGTNPKPDGYVWSFQEEGSLVELNHDGTSGTLGTWTLEGGFSPLLEGIGGAWVQRGAHLAMVVDEQAEVGTLVVLDKETLAEALRVPRVHRATPWFSYQAPALGYVHGWDDALGAGTLGAWISANGQQIDVDTGVSEFDEIYWPEPGIVYAVRTPERAGLWSAYPDF